MDIETTTESQETTPITQATTTQKSESAGDGDPSYAAKTAAEMSDEELAQAIAAKKAQGKNAPDKQPPQPKAGNPEKKPQSQPQDLDKLQKIVQDQKAFIGRQSNEVHAVREENKQLREKLVELESQVNRASRKPMTEEEKAKFFDDPSGWIDEELKRRDEARTSKDNLTADEREKQEQEQREQFKANYQAIVTALPEGENIDELMPLMLEVVIDDFTSMGMSKEETEAAVIDFAKNPWKERPAAVVALAKRALAEKKLRANQGGKAAAKTPERKVSLAMSSAHGKSGRDLPTGGLSRADIAEMSDEELAAYKEQIKKRKSGG